MSTRSPNQSASRTRSSARDRGDPNASVRTLRCAVYTRVSTDAGLEQEFNVTGANFRAKRWQRGESKSAKCDSSFG